MSNAADEVSDNLYLTVKVGDQPFGIPVLCVHDVSKSQRITRVPLAPPEVMGAMNLRGRIVTVIDVARKLNLSIASGTEAGNAMYVVIEHENELYSLKVDSVGDVMAPPSTDVEQNPANMEAGWREVSAGVCRLEGELLVLLDVARFFGIVKSPLVSS
jgi:purine-binding chemotaxis protein CheW